jgi:hypothetical protein
MKNLNLNEIGLVELGESEAKQANGGSLLAWFIGIVVVGTIVDAIWDIERLHTPADLFRD